VFEPPQNDAQARPAWAGGAEGQYTWLATVTPAATESSLGTADKRLYEVSVVVFCQRDMSSWQTMSTGLPSGFSVGSPDDPDKPSERVVQIGFTGNGLGGGDATLQCLSTEPAAMLEVRANDWIMVGGRQPLPAAPFFRNIFKWYRVVTADTEDTTAGNYRQRRITLAGSDWDWSTNWGYGAAGWRVDTNPPPAGNNQLEPNDTAQAVLFSGIIGVYTQTIEISQ
jgi:hypothetical protein